MRSTPRSSHASISLDAFRALRETFPPPQVLDVRRAAAFERDPTLIPGAVRCLPERRRHARPHARAVAAGRRGVRPRPRGQPERGRAARVVRVRRELARWRPRAVAQRRRRHGAVARAVALGHARAAEDRPHRLPVARPALRRSFRGVRLRARQGGPRRSPRRTARRPTTCPASCYTHRGERCSFDAFLEAFGLADPALDRLATIVRGADTAARPRARGAGLLAVSLGLSQRYADDHAMLALRLLALRRALRVVPDDRRDPAEPGRAARARPRTARARDGEARRAGRAAPRRARGAALLAQARLRELRRARGPDRDHASRAGRRPRWISERRFLHALNYCMLLPGPEATQLATYIGWLLHRTWGGVVAGALFVLPSLVHPDRAVVDLHALRARAGDRRRARRRQAGGRRDRAARGVAHRPARRCTIRWRGRSRSRAFVALQVFDVPFPASSSAAALVGVVGVARGPARVHAHGRRACGVGRPHEPSVIDDDTPTPAHARFSRRRMSRRSSRRSSRSGAWRSAAIVAGLRRSGTYAAMAWLFTKAALRHVRRCVRRAALHRAERRRQPRLAHRRADDRRPRARRDHARPADHGRRVRRLRRRVDARGARPGQRRGGRRARARPSRRSSRSCRRSCSSSPAARWSSRRTATCASPRRSPASPPRSSASSSSLAVFFGAHVFWPAGFVAAHPLQGLDAWAVAIFAVAIGALFRGGGRRDSRRPRRGRCGPAAGGGPVRQAATSALTRPRRSAPSPTRSPAPAARASRRTTP